MNIKVYCPKTLALTVRDMRKELNLSQEKVSELGGLDIKTVGMFENNPQGVKLNTVFRILDAIGLQITIEKKE